VAGGAGLEFVELEVRRGPRGPLVRVFLDKPGNIGLGDIENASREISAILDVEDPIKGAYTLEVSSPGMTRPIRTPRDFERALGKLVRVSYRPEGGASPREAVGRVAGVDAGSVRLIPVDSKGREGEPIAVAIESLVFARREIIF
jgi:ribosome maturation factor RimP